jgi:hypothetical protein
MKKKINFIVIITQFIFVLSCTKENQNIKNDGLPYYQFSQEDKTRLINKPNIGDEIIYKNQNNEVLKFTVIKSDLGKNTFSTGNFASSYSTNHFYYDNQEISMKYIPGNHPSGNCEINIRKYPIGSNYQTQYPVIGTPKFYGYFDFPLWNGFRGTDLNDITISIDFDLPTTVITFNGKTYTKVRIFESNKTTILEVNNPPPFLPRNVHKIYYDDNKGIIGFDDLNDNVWRIE